LYCGRVLEGLDRRASGALDRRPQLDVGGRLLRLAEEQARARGLREVRLHTNEAMSETLATTCGAATDSEQVQAAAETVRQRAADVLADAPLSWSWAAVGRTGDVLEQQADAVDAYLIVVGLPAGGLGAAADHRLTGSDTVQLRRASQPLLPVPPVAQHPQLFDRQG